MKPVLHAVIVYHMVACGGRTKAAPYHMCQLSCRRLCWTTCDLYEKQFLLRMLRLSGDCMAMVMPWRHRSSAASEWRRMPWPSRDDRWPHCPWATAPRPYDSWFELAPFGSARPLVATVSRCDTCVVYVTPMWRLLCDASLRRVSFFSASRTPMPACCQQRRAL